MRSTEDLIVEPMDKHKRNELHFENNEGLRSYLLELGSRILEAALEPPDPALAHRDFLAEVHRKDGMASAAELIYVEAEKLRKLS